MPTTSLDEFTVPASGGGTGPATQPPVGELGTHRRAAEPDAVCAQAIPAARTAAEELAGRQEVGEHLGLLAEGERLVTHYFECRRRGYRGWRWAITVARAPRARSATVCETVLLPGDDAVLAPPWVPWSDRLAPGDLGAADVLPFREDDPLLDPGYTQTADEEVDRVAVWELGLGRARVLGPRGRDEVADRWYHGDRGPTADEAVHAAAACSTCGYFLPLAGSLRQVFGVCAQEWSPSDGRVVSVDHGCGAHSETDVEHPEPPPLPEPILDETGAEAVVLPPRPPAAPPGPAAGEGQDAEPGGPAAGEGQDAEPGGPAAGEGQDADPGGPATSGEVGAYGDDAREPVQVALPVSAVAGEPVAAGAAAGLVIGRSGTGWPDEPGLPATESSAWPPPGGAGDDEPER